MQERFTPRNSPSRSTLAPNPFLPILFRRWGRGLRLEAVLAVLLSPLNSATRAKSADVEAELSQPLIDQGHLILPAGTHLRGTVLQVRSARSLHRNGQLRISFREVVLPDGAVQTVDTRLEGMQSDSADNAQLDSEGGAKSTSSKTRYLSTGVSVGLALIGSGGRKDVGDASPIAGGATGFKLVGLIVGIAFRSHTYGILMSAYGGTRSIYKNFLGKGRNIVFPKNTMMEIGFGNRASLPMPAAATRRITMKKWPRLPMRLRHPAIRGAPFTRTKRCEIRAKSAAQGRPFRSITRDRRRRSRPELGRHGQRES